MPRMGFIFGSEHFFKNWRVRFLNPPEDFFPGGLSQRFHGLDHPVRADVLGVVKARVVVHKAHQLQALSFAGDVQAGKGRCGHGTLAD